MNIKTLTIEQLKALAYDLVVQMKSTENNLRTVEQEMTSRPQEVKPEVKPEVKNDKKK